MAHPHDNSGIDWYAQLDVRPDASGAEIDDAYRRLARALHPDSAHPRAVDVERLQLVLEAHDILSNPSRRRAYDEGRGFGPKAPPSRDLTACLVCRGTRLIRTPCPRCLASGYLSAASVWLRRAEPCHQCRGTGWSPTPCGACAATGYVTRPTRVSPSVD